MITFTPDSATSARNSAIARLRDLGYIPLPVAPAQDASQYPATNKQGEIITNPDGSPKPKFNGKNPSFLDSAGTPHLVSWRKYLTRQVGNREILQWWSNPVNGVGTCSGQWLDIDLKRFPDRAAMDDALRPILDLAEWVEVTQGGGYRIAIAPATAPDFTLFGIGDHPHVGEIIKDGFVVLAPTQGVHGAYTALRYGAPLAVDSVSDLGIYRRAAKAAPEPATAPLAVPEPAPAPDTTTAPPLPATGLLALASKKTQNLASGNGGGDRSGALVTIAKELYGWENLAVAEGVTIPDSADSILMTLAARWDCADKVDRVLADIPRSACEPAILMAQNRAAAVSKLRWVYRAIEPSDILLDSEDSPGSVAYDKLYAGGDYVRIEDTFYKWVGTHYEPQDERAEKTRIREVLNRCIRQTEKATTRPWRSASKICDAYQWALMSVRFVPSDVVNPPGHINLTNGVFHFDYSDGLPKPELLPHSPEMVFTYAPQVAYHPEADPTHANRLLAALPDNGRTAVLRVLASAIDIAAIRAAWGRDSRILFFAGSGANGKDAIREAFVHIFGNCGVTSATIGDFVDYHQGRKFSLAPLISSRINWASENNTRVNIDELNPLKHFVTGEELQSERKFADPIPFIPKAICIFNTNDTVINLTAKKEASAGRYAIVFFRKTFVSHPKNPDQLKADPRFKYDVQWVKAHVCPALLNILVAEFQNLFREGVDYSALDAELKRNLLEANHLARFCHDCNLIEDPESSIETGMVWERLRTWYQSEGILTISHDGRETWEGDIREGDKWLRGAQQLTRKLRDLYPGMELKRTGSARLISGLRFASDAEMALRAVNAAEEYQTALKLYGAAAIEKAWSHLPRAKQELIAQWIEPEEVSGQVAILLDAISGGNTEAVAYFSEMTPLRKAAIWARLSEADRRQATEFIKRANSG